MPARLAIAPFCCASVSQRMASTRRKKSLLASSSSDQPNSLAEYGLGEIGSAKPEGSRSEMPGAMLGEIEETLLMIRNAHRQSSLSRHVLKHSCNPTKGVIHRSSTDFPHPALPAPS